jgi:hypothetical protein
MEDSDSCTSKDEELDHADALLDLINYVSALKYCKNTFQKKLEEQGELLHSESMAVCHFKAEAARLSSVVEEQQQKIDEMKKKIMNLSNHLNYYKKSRH